MNPPDLKTFFAEATKKPEPYDYQCRLACGDRGTKQDTEWLSGGTPCESRLINIPTGLGKTAAVVLAWLWNRVMQPDEPARAKWPRRLVYCLPMRTLVEQTETEVKKWLGEKLWDGKGPHKDKVGLHILMGGEDAGEWDIYPEEDAILIGTQDMLLSRALNRGYGMNRYRWPMHFGLLNNDALWVMDETQLMGVGVETSAQLDGFRAPQKCPTWWMSATLEDSRLATVDHLPPSGGWPCEKLTDVEKTQPGRPKDLFESKKPVTRWGESLSPALKSKDYAKRVAERVAERHKKLCETPHKNGTLTLVVVNRVERARDIFTALTATGKKGKQIIPSLVEADTVALIHSRFRSKDREKHESLLFGKGDRIVIATQAVEAGVDVSARLLITELAPWSSIVQRIGRCNRYADIPDAEVLWVNVEPDAKGDLLLPYTADELAKARDAISGIAEASPRALSGVKVDEPKVIRSVIRRRDLVDLFDTTPDICGQDLDISRYIRDEGDSDVQFFWREIAGDTPGENELPPSREELCRVSIGEAAKFLGKKTRAWRWNPLDEQWVKETTARAGGVYLIDVASGGYSAAIGWTGNADDQPEAHTPEKGENESHASNRSSFVGQWQTIADHTAEVIRETMSIAEALQLPKSDAATLRTAALWHDVGKAHCEFQKMLRAGELADGHYYAKSDPDKPQREFVEYRPIRHELASALAWLLAGPPDDPERDLVAFLIAAHHGKVRLSIRSLPEEQGDPEDTERLFARGIWQGDILPTVNLGELSTEPVPLDLSFMRMGEGPHGPSWLARTIALRDRLGPFRIAFLEAVLRAADARASAANSPALANAK